MQNDNLKLKIKEFVGGILRGVFFVSYPLHHRVLRKSGASFSRVGLPSTTFTSEPIEVAQTAFSYTPRKIHKSVISKSGAGFTLIEMIVSVALFTVVMFVSVGALLAIADANRKANALRITMDNLNFAMESMSRTMRTGSGYSCGIVPVSPPAFGTNCLGGGSSFSFTDQNGATVIYVYDSDKETVVAKKEGQSDFYSLTSPEIRVESLTFYVTGIGNTVGDEGHQPRVVIVIKGKAGTTERTQTSFNIQTTVSQRRVES